MFPNGCIDGSIKSRWVNVAGLTNRWRSECSSGTWFSPSLNKSSCEAIKGCHDVMNEIATVGIQYAFSLKDYANCTAVSDVGRTWTSIFSWEQGTWIQASFR